ncbi:MAG: helix-turn-helix transcriptional regulator [Clostridiales bacterium]|nr:helix-turn-helix transcriptional regulator [Clostridiales bacterium]
MRYVNQDMDNNSIGKRIRNAREKLKLTREEFSELIGLSSFYVGQLERGERQMSLNTLIKISSHLHVSTDYLIYGDKDNYVEKSRILILLNRCSKKQLSFIENIIQLVLSYSNDKV